MESNTSGTAFRIGGWYRRMNNEVVRLGPMDDCNKWYWRMKEPSRSFGIAYRNGNEFDAVGYICLQSGRYCGEINEAVNDHHLLPGELHQVNGEWVPVEAPAAASVPTSIPFERPRTQREAEWMLRQAMAKDVAEAAAREAEARRCAPLPACAGLLRLAPLGR